MNRPSPIAAKPCIAANSLAIRTASTIRAVLILVSMAMPASGQLTITNPANVDQATVRTVGAVVPNASMQGIQIHVSTVKLWVDPETRNSIYQNVGDPGFSVQTSMDPPPTPLDLATVVGGPLQSRVTVRSPTTCAMAVIDRSVSDQIISMVSQANPASVKRSPAVMLSNGKVAEMNDVVEHPFAIGFDSQTARANVEKFEEGMKIRLLAMPGPKSTRFVAEMISSQITSVGQTSLPVSSTQTGDPIAIQVPVQQTQSVVISAALAAGQCLIVDPHVTKSVITTEESPTPMIGKIPYIGKNFSSTVSVQVDRHLLVLLMPSMVPR